MLTPPVFDIFVGKSALSFNRRQFNDISNRFNTENVDGTEQPILFELESVSAGINGSTATISFQRKETTHVSHIYRRSPVNITLSGVVIFLGFVNRQTTMKRKTVLTCIGIEQIIDNIPIIGANRFRDSLFSIFRKETLSIFNESNLPDMLQRLPRSDDLKLENGEISDIRPKKWTKIQIVLYVFDTIFRDRSGQNYGILFQGGILSILNVVSELKRAISLVGESNLNEMDNDFTLTSGLYTLLLEGLRESKLIGYFDPNAVRVRPTLSSGKNVFVVNNLFAIKNKKTVVADPTSKVGDSKSIIHYDYSANYDFGATSQVAVVSGRRYISTTLVIDPNNTLYTVISNLSEQETGRMVFEHKPTANRFGPVFESDNNDAFAGLGYFQAGLFESGKVGFVNSIRNRIKSVDENTGEIVFIEDREILIRFKDDVLYESAGDIPILMNGEIWERLKGENNNAEPKVIGDQTLGKLDKLRWKLDNDKLKLTIDGFKPDAFEIVQDSIKFIYIPVTIEIDDRIIGVSTRKEAQQTILTEEKFYEDSNPSFHFDPEERGIEVIERNDLHPVTFLSNIIDLDFNVVFDNRKFDDFTKVRVKRIAKEVLLDNILSDGTSLNVTIPMEIWLILREDSSYPVAIGDWIDKVDGVNGVGDILFDRRLTLTQINYNRTTVTLILT